ncbi:hypothetical protein B0A67_07895 [Flavobacterium aquidurense]|uniref:hypothetical protein n=1 Tax=Flavobacterium aquidurense TaxID=362413 RepID=UPI00091C923F|nr:hypothetical protein [Flavobacterium aquidurense]OXA72453.1 hypothetical protein B0A67_07895 [Flavobacterium aquidurense]SHG40827.1 hypothetical protein SAMN05444481_104112 [Flavobacterium frigidimaris]
MNIITNSDFDETFSSLKRMGERLLRAKNAFELLKKLNKETTNPESDILISEIDKIQYQSNTNSYFYFYFPIVSHVLYYKPQYEKDILKYLIGPNFANGTSEVDEMIAMIKGAMNFKLQENKLYLTKESQFWFLNELPKLEKEIQREIDVCWKELDE